MRMWLRLAPMPVPNDDKLYALAVIDTDTKQYIKRNVTEEFLNRSSQYIIDHVYNELERMLVSQVSA